jgi:predicted secreted protein
VTFTIGVLVYVMIWVVILFMVLPWGAKPSEQPEVGHATSAPEKPHIGLKMLITSLIAFFLWLVAYLVLYK